MMPALSLTMSADALAALRPAREVNGAAWKDGGTPPTYNGLPVIESPVPLPDGVVAALIARDAGGEITGITLIRQGEPAKEGAKC